MDITPRGKSMHQRRQQLCSGSRLAQLVVSGGTLRRSDIEQEAELFSAGALDQPQNEPERAALEEALFAPPAGLETGNYDRFIATVKMTLAAVETGVCASADCIAKRYSAVISSDPKDISASDAAWAAYEMHRRAHFALELLLQALTEEVRDRDGATVAEVVRVWAAQPDLPAAVHERLNVAGHGLPFGMHVESPP